MIAFCLFIYFTVTVSLFVCYVLEAGVSLFASASRVVTPTAAFHLLCLTAEELLKVPHSLVSGHTRELTSFLLVLTSSKLFLHVHMLLILMILAPGFQILGWCVHYCILSFKGWQCWLTCVWWFCPPHLWLYLLGVFLFCQLAHESHDYIFISKQLFVGFLVHGRSV